MTQTTEILAFVREWDTESVRVRCPFCSRTHSHGPGSLDFMQDTTSDALHKRRRAPHCGHLSDDYLFCFPFEDAAQRQGYSWWIDKKRQMYVTVGLPSEVEDEDYFIEVPDLGDHEDRVSTTSEASRSSGFAADSADELANEFQSKAQLEDTCFADFYKQEMMSLKSRKVWFISHCLLKETAKVKHMLRQYRKDTLYNDRNQYGDDIMSMVAMEGHVYVMELLHDAGAMISNVNTRGRTPLMEAAFWGRDDAVKFLLAKGADFQMKDHKDRTALDLAQDTDQNRREHEARSSMYRDSQDLRQARIRIRARLESLTSTLPKVRGASQDFVTPFDGHFQRVGLDLVWYDRAVSYGLDYDTRTIGMLVYSRYLPTMSAMSGSNHYLPHRQTLDNRVWTFKVRDLCAVIGFDLQRDPRDNLFDGSFNACHAEKQLATYYIDQHFYWGNELKHARIKELQKMKPIGMPPRATIAVNRGICPDCEAFLRRVRDEFVVQVDALFR